MSDWKLHVGSTPGYVALEIVIYRNAPNNCIEVLQFREDGTTTSVIRDEGIYSKEDITMRVKPGDFYQIVKAFTKYNRDNGFKDVNESSVEGKLLATEKHLEDMRTLVFKPSEIITVEAKPSYG